MSVLQLKLISALEKVFLDEEPVERPFRWPTPRIRTAPFM